MASAGTVPTELGELLCIIIDVNPLSWSLSASPTPSTSDPSNPAAADSLSLTEALSALLLFCNAHLALKHENQIAIWAANHGPPQLLYSSQAGVKAVGGAGAGTESAGGDAEGKEYQQFRVVDRAVVDKVKGVMEREVEEGKGKSGVVGALAMALCHINRHRLLPSATAAAGPSSSPHPARLLLLSASPDHSPHYVSTMNCIFAAQKAAVPIDVCKAAGQDAVFLQQAAHLTGGSYYRLARRAGLLQYLMMAFLPGVGARKNLTLPRQEEVDLRAACFCHRKIVDVGYVCSVCLSIFCAPRPVCQTCQTKFPLSTLKRLGFGAKPNGAAGTPVRRKRKVGGGTPAPGGTSLAGGGTPGPGEGEGTPVPAA